MDGYSSQRCTKCGDTRQYHAPALGHSWQLVNTPDCIVAARYQCSVCGVDNQTSERGSCVDADGNGRCDVCDQTMN